MADHLRLRGQVSVLSESHHFEGRPAGRILQPDISEIQAQHLRQHVEQSTDNLGRLSATPDGGKRLNADQVVDAGLEALNLIGRLLDLRFHRQLTSGRYVSPGRTALAQLPQKLIRRHKKRVLLDDAADQNHRMRPQDVHYNIPAKLREIVNADDRVFIPGPDIVHPRLILHQVIDTRLLFQSPFHMGNHTGQRKSLLSVALKHLLLDQRKHSILIETPVAQIDIIPTTQVELAALLSRGHIDSGGGQPPPVFVTEFGIDDMKGLMAALEPVLDERKHHAILLISRMKKSTDMALRAKL